MRQRLDETSTWYDLDRLHEAEDMEIMGGYVLAAVGLTILIVLMGLAI